MSNPIQLLPAAAVEPAAAAVVLAPLVLLRHHSHRARPIAQRIGAKLPPIPGLKGYVDAPYRPEPPCSSDTDLVAVGSSPILSLLLLLGVGAVSSKSPGIPTPRIAPRKRMLVMVFQPQESPRENACWCSAPTTQEPPSFTNSRLRLLMLLYRQRMQWGCAWSLRQGLRLLLLLLMLLLPGSNSSDTSTKLHPSRLRLLLLMYRRRMRRGCAWNFRRGPFFLLLLLLPRPHPNHHIVVASVRFPNFACSPLERLKPFPQ